MPEQDTSLRVGELAKETRISVRTLHHYEKIGLLCASGRTAAGHRVYLQRDLERLQQIVSLRDLGLSLPEIRHCLDVEGASLQQVLASHRRALDERILQLERSRMLLTGLLARLSGPDLLRCIVERKAMRDENWSPDLSQRMQGRAREVGEERYQEAREESRALMRQVREHHRQGHPCDHPEVIELAKRVQAARLVITGGDPVLTAGLRRFNDASFARSGADGGATDPALIRYVEEAGKAMS